MCLFPRRSGEDRSSTSQRQAVHQEDIRGRVISTYGPSMSRRARRSRMEQSTRAETRVLERNSVVLLVRGSWSRSLSRSIVSKLVSLRCYDLPIQRDGDDDRGDLLLPFLTALGSLT